MKTCRKISFECILVTIIVLSLTIALFIFKDNISISEMIIVALTNSLVLVITKYFDIKDKKSTQDNANDTSKNDASK